MIFVILIYVNYVLGTSGFDSRRYLSSLRFICLLQYTKRFSKTKEKQKTEELIATTIL